MYIIKEKLEGNIKLGKNVFTFDFTNEQLLPIKFHIVINFNNNNDINYGGYINEDDFKTNRLNYFRTGFNLNVNITDININYNMVYSIVNHELVHCYDIYYDENIESFDKLNSYRKLKQKYYGKVFIDFIELSNLALKHELDARTSMIYDKLRWLKTYDRKELKDEFLKTYTYKSMMMLKDFNFTKILQDKEVFIFTNEYIKQFLGENKILNTKEEIYNFYINIKNVFNKIADEYLKKCYEVIEELIKDKTPYIENVLLNTKDAMYYSEMKLTEKGINSLIISIFENVIR